MSLPIFNGGGVSDRARFGEEVKGEAGTVCWRFGAGVHAGAFSGVATATAFCAGAGWLCGEAGAVPALSMGR